MDRKIGRYEIRSELGRGAMGVVYLAEDPLLHRSIALKTIHLPHGLSREQRESFEKRFLREARAAGGLSHPGIVTVYDIADVSGETPSFIAMEYVPGRSLDDLLRSEVVVDPERAFGIVDAVADALYAAHQTGIVHRDVKPANILLRDPDGAAKIVDFGIARLSSSELTQVGSTLGSPAYMSPEQLAGGTADARSDLFSLAVILYEALCGERPFAHEDSISTAHAILHDAPLPISSRAGRLPPGLDRFFERALAKDPAERFQDAAVFRDALRAARLPTDIVPPRRRKSRWMEASIAGLLAFVALVCILAWQRRGGDSPSESVPGSAFDPEMPQPAAALESPPPAPVLQKAHLAIDARSKVKQGRLRLLVDNKPVFAWDLSALEKREGRTYTKILGRPRESFSERISVAPGRRRIVAILEVEGKEPFERTLLLDLEPGEDRELQLVAGRTVGAPLSLRQN